jgi:SMC interacting uncharacterized protein involved in chromosome segregation
MEQLHSGAQTMLAYFHYCCKGYQPFLLADESDEVFSMAELDAEQIGFIREIAKELKRREEHIRTVKETGNVEHPLYFVSQLFEENWEPRSTA